MSAVEMEHLHQNVISNASSWMCAILFL
jgi:hypothetical protein